MAQFRQMPASVIAQRVGWSFPASVLRTRVAVLRLMSAPADPADRTTYAGGEIAQRDLGRRPRACLMVCVSDAVRSWGGSLENERVMITSNGQVQVRRMTNRWVRAG